MKTISSGRPSPSRSATATPPCWFSNGNQSGIGVHSPQPAPGAAPRPAAMLVLEREPVGDRGPLAPAPRDDAAHIELTADAVVALVLPRRGVGHEDDHLRPRDAR